MATATLLTPVRRIVQGLVAAAIQVTIAAAVRVAVRPAAVTAARVLALGAGKATALALIGMTLTGRVIARARATLPGQATHPARRHGMTKIRPHQLLGARTMPVRVDLLLIPPPPALEKRK